MSFRMNRIYVIIPVYNCKKYVETAVCSVEEQPFKNVIIILVDDGSSDGSAELCDKLSDAYSNIVVIHKINAGLSAARNSGIEYVLSSQDYQPGDGDYFAFLDADDAWYKNSVNDKLVEQIDQYYDLVGLCSCFTDEKMKSRALPGPIKTGSFHGGKGSLWIHANQSFGAMLYSCDFVMREGLRFVAGLKYCEDKVFSLECLYKAECVYLSNNIFYLYRQNFASITHNRPYGSVYYEPIINGYIALNSRLENWGNHDFSEGMVLAKIYIMDMIDEMLGRNEPLDAINNILASHAEYRQIVENKQWASNDTRYEEFIKNPSEYAVKCKIKYITVGIRNVLKRSGIAREIFSRIRYKIRINWD